MKFRSNSEGTMNLIRLKSGESLRGVFRGDVHEFKQHWSENRSVVCPGLNLCEKCANGEKASFRFSINFVLKENEHYIAKVWEQGWQTYLALKALHEGGYDLEKYLMKISRSGATKNDTTYSIVPVPNGLLSPAQLVEVSKVKLVQLGDEKKEPSSTYEATVTNEEDDSIPF